MKTIIFCLVMAISLGSTAQVPFSRGVNLTGWFQAASPRQIQFTRYTRKDFEQIRSLGVDAIRLPINLHAMTNGSPGYELDPLFLEFLDEVVNWSEELHINLILDNHTFDVNTNTDPAVGDVLVRVWKQLAAHYKDRTEYVFYEILNEPHGISDVLWGNIQQRVIDSIRTVDQSHYIVVGSANWNNYNNLSQLPHYTDSRLIYTFHFYDPFIFTHQGASWTNPSMVPLAGVPFPYRSADMPSTPDALKGTWVESAMNNYLNDGTVARVKALLDIAINFRKTRNVILYCGEFGVHIPNSNNADRVYWYDIVRKYLEANGIPWTIWDYQGGFGVFEKGSNEWFEYDLNVSLLEALGLTVPPQQTWMKWPVTSSITLYDDYMHQGIVNASSVQTGTLDFYYEQSPQQGSRCIYWTNVSQYNTIAFNFKPDLDLSLLPVNDYVLEFWVRGNKADAKFDIRFIDSKAGSTDHPWRKGKTIDNTVAQWDGTWKKISLPLKELEDKGAYDNGWIPPPGNFDWKNVDRFEIVAEHSALTGIEFSFDDIRMVGKEVTYDPVTVVTEPTVNFDVYPNPMNTDVAIRFSLAKDGPVVINIYSLQGQWLTQLLSDTREAGEYEIKWEGNVDQNSTLPAGLYFVEIRAEQSRMIRKLVKLF